MKIGLQIMRFDWPGSPETTGSRLAEMVHAADEIGFDSIWLMDHFFQLMRPHLNGPEAPMYEAYSTLGFIVAFTSRAKLGVMVTGANYRHPGLLIKTVTGLDVLSGGRLYLGLGVGWYERESLGLGFPFPPTKERFEWLEETLQIAKQMWADDATPYAGQHFTLTEPLTRPQPLSKPHPPILIGGGGEQKTLRLVAQYADACNLFAWMGQDELRHKLDVLRAHCDDVGRDYDSIEKTLIANVNFAADGSAAPIVDELGALAELGFEHVIFSDVPGAHEITPLETIGRDVIPAVKGL